MGVLQYLHFSCSCHVAAAAAAASVQQLLVCCSYTAALPRPVTNRGAMELLLLSAAAAVVHCACVAWLVVWLSAHTTPFCRALPWLRVAPCLVFWVHALAQRPFRGICLGCRVGLLGGGRPPSSGMQAQHWTPSTTRHLLTHRISSRCSLERGLGPPFREGATSGARGRLLCVLCVGTPVQPLLLPCGVGTGPWWTWWTGLLSPDGKKKSRLGVGAPGTSSTGLSLPVGWVPPFGGRE